MPKVEDYVAYFKELAGKAGLSEEQAKGVIEVLNNPTIREGFVPRPNYSSDLDSVVAKTKAEATAQAKAFYDDWFAKEGKPAYDKSQQVIKDYAQYVALYGPLDGSPSGSNPSAGGNGNYATPEQVKQSISEALAATMGSVVNMQKKSMRVAAKHLREFNEVLDPDDLEKFASEKGYRDIDQAYQAYVSPRIEEKRNAEWEAKVKAARDEGAKEERSRLKVPHDFKSREYVNPFTKPREKVENPEAASRDAFLSGWDADANKK